jgi:glucokinase
MMHRDTAESYPFVATGMEKGCRILAADIGGTRSRFAYFDYAGGELGMGDVVRIPTAEAIGFDDLLDRVRVAAPGAWARLTQQTDTGNDAPDTPDASVTAFAAFAVAGPVEEGARCLPPNIGWHIDLDTTRGLPCAALLLNDFEAQGWACLLPGAQQCLQLLPGKPDATAPVAVVGAGTGLGKCLLLPGTPHRVLPSEGGHATFAFEGRAEAGYAAFAADRLGVGRLIGDDVLSGPGLSLLYAYHHGETLPPHEVAARLTGSDVVVEWFARFYGRTCRDWALHTLARGGVRIAGGVAAANPLLVQHEAFAAAFFDCPTHAHLLRTIPVSLVTNADAGLWGAAVFALLHAGTGRMTR